MNTAAILEIITLLIGVYYKHAEMEGLTEADVDARLDAAIAEKKKRRADDLPDV